MKTIASLSGLALLAGLALAAAPSAASAQVIIQGEVRAYPAQPQPYAQPQGYVSPGPSPYVGVAPAPQPVRYIHHSDPITGLAVAGIIGVGVGWLGGAIVATAAVGGSGYSSSCRGSGCPDDTWAYLHWVPIIGPWLALGLGNGRDWEPLSYVAGALQDVGLILFILGLAIRDEWDEPVYAFGDGPDAARLYLSAGPTQGGLQTSATLTF
jgi:hypothetical protein